MVKRILIVSFTFPPYSGIGGRRWAKFAKYFNRAGHQVEVIAGKPGFQKNSPWTKDIEGLNVNYHNTGYPKFLGIQPKSFFEKLMYRLSLMYMKATTKGNYYDKSAKWNESLKKEVIKKVAQGVEVVYVTCAPFQMACHLIPIKQQFPKTKWVVDFRDPWTSNRTAYGFEGLSDKRQQFEIDAEKAVIKDYDEVISVAEPMTAYFKTLYPTQTEKFKTIFNGYDPEDFPNPPNPNEKSTETINLVFAGNLYDKAMFSFRLFAKAIENLKSNNFDLYKRIHLTFIGVESRKAKELNHPNLKILPYLPFQQVREHLYKAHIGLLFLTPDIDWSFSTKFTDYMGAKLPVLVVSESQSETGRYCEEKGLGLNISIANYLDTDLWGRFNKLSPDAKEFSKFAIDLRGFGLAQQAGL